MPQFLGERKKKKNNDLIYIVFSNILEVNTLWLFQATHMLSLKADVERDADNQLVEASASQLERSSDIILLAFSSAPSNAESQSL